LAPGRPADLVDAHLDRHPNYVLAAYMASGTELTLTKPN
jgi:hypothetical protein